MMDEILGGGGVKPIPTIVPTPTEYEKANEEGFRTLWVYFVILVVSIVLFFGLSWKVPTSRRLFNSISIIVAVVGSIAYFASASGHAVSYSCISVRDTHKHVPDTFHDVCRQVFWAHYVDWAITTPLLLTELSLLAGLDGAKTLAAAVGSLVFVLSSLFGAFGGEDNSQKWGWFVFSCAGYLVVVWNIVLHGTLKARGKGKRTILFGSLTTFLTALLTVHLVVWAVADGARNTTVDAGIVSFGILDVLLKLGFGLWIIMATRYTPEAQVEISGYWAEGVAGDGQIRIGDEA